ncbi:MAG TPA: choice-of-anchor tandem repeat GloVer-containing protein, partial [Verrucomicrobiae bacterium]
LYGMTEFGGSADVGAVFKGSTDGSGFTNLYSFTAPNNSINSDGYYPYASLILSGNTLYGTTLEGGTSGFGVVFSLTLPAPPQLTITRSGTNVIVTWPANAAGFALQSATNLVSPSVWSTNLPAPVVVNGQNTVTNAISGTRQFYRLTQ